MAVMQAPRTRHAKPPEQRAQEPVPPVAAEPDDPWLWNIFQNLDLGEDVKVEYIQDTIVVRGIACRWHEEVVVWLADQFKEPCEARGLKRATGGGLEPLPGPARSIRPDLLIYDSSSLTSPDTWDVTPGHARLVAEVVSASSTEADRAHKPLSCAQAGIPLYICVDRFVTPVTVTLLSQPGPDGYQHQEPAPAGPDGGKLTIPEPFGIVLDLTTLPLTSPIP
jgi:Uma2 family endonuclease